MPDLYADVTRQNVTELLYKANLINNTDLQESEALSNIVGGIVERSYTSTADIQTDVNNGTITLDTYIYVSDPAFAPRFKFVDTAGNILEKYS